MSFEVPCPLRCERARSRALRSEQLLPLVAWLSECKRFVFVEHSERGLRRRRGLCWSELGPRSRR